MKKLLSLLAAIAFVATSSAQVLASYDFENGTNEGWTVWQKKTNNLVEGPKAKDSKYSYEVKVGTYFDTKGFREGETYVVTCDSKFVWGKEAPQMTVGYYNPEIKKLETIHTAKLPMEKDYTKFTTEFKAKKGIMHRITFSCTPGAQSTFIIDNVKVEKKK